MKIFCIALPVIVAFCVISSIAAVDDISALLDEDTNYWNTVVDAIVGPLTTETQKSIADVVSIPDFHETFNEKILFAKIQGNVDATGGTLEDLESIKRGGEASFMKHGTSYLLSCPLEVKVIKIDYKNYMASMGKLKISGSMKGTVGTVTANVTIEVSFDADKKCSVALEDLEIVKFEDIEVFLKGLGPLNKLASQIANLQLTERKDANVNIIDAAVRGTLAAEINKINGKYDLEQIIAWIQEQH